MIGVPFRRNPSGITFLETDDDDEAIVCVRKSGENGEGFRVFRILESAR